MVHKRGPTFKNKNTNMCEKFSEREFEAGWNAGWNDALEKMREVQIKLLRENKLNKLADELEKKIPVATEQVRRRAP